MKKINLFDFDICNASPQLCSLSLKEMLSVDRFHRVVTLNPQMVMASLIDDHLKSWIQTADIITADGQGISLALRLLKQQSCQRCTGIDLVMELLQKPYRFYFVGGSSAVLERMLNSIQNKYPNAIVSGAYHGFLSDDQERDVIAEIEAVQPDFIFVAMGFPKQEYFIQHCSFVCKRGIAIGVGGVFDVLSGYKNRAPVWVQNMKMEWFFRSFQDPVRIFRLGYLFRYVVYVFKLFFLKLLKRAI